MASRMSWSASHRINLTASWSSRKELFVPLERHPRLRPGKNADNNVRADRSNEWVHIHGRLSPGVGIAQASAAVSAVTSRLAKQYPATNEFKAGIVEAYHPIGNLERSRIPDSRGRRAHPDRNGASGRVPEYLRHDAGSQRDA